MLCCKKKKKGKPESSSGGEPAERILFAFDFDHTIIDDNSDVAITTTISKPIPDSIRQLFDGTNWETYMEKVLQFVRDQGVSLGTIEKALRELRLAPGMEHLVQRISKRCKEEGPDGTHFLVISDANNFFITTLLSGLSPPVVPSSIISNHSEIRDGFLKLTPYEFQNKCPLCPHNLCKGDALMKFIENKGPFSRVFYAGDGGNDVCPATRLTERDIVFVRKGYAMEKIIARGVFKQVPIIVKAKIVYYEDAKTIEQTCF